MFVVGLLCIKEPLGGYSDPRIGRMKTQPLKEDIEMGTMEISSRLKSVSQKQRTACLNTLAVTMMLFSGVALAGDAQDGTTAFNSVWTTLQEWIQGTLGRIVAVSMILVGIVAGIARQSLMAFAIGIAGGMGLYNTPTIVNGIMGATLGY